MEVCMHKIIIAGVMLFALALNAEVQKYWSDTPVTCHWIGKVKRANTIQIEYEEGNYPVSRRHMRNGQIITTGRKGLCRDGFRSFLRMER